MPQKIIHRRHLESGQFFLQEWPQFRFLSQVAKAVIGRTCQEVNCKGVFVEKPQPDCRVNDAHKRPFSRRLNQFPSGKARHRFNAPLREFLPSFFAFLTHLVECISQWQSSTPIKRLWSKSKKRPNPSQLKAKTFSGRQSLSASY